MHQYVMNTLLNASFRLCLKWPGVCEIIAVESEARSLLLNFHGARVFRREKREKTTMASSRRIFALIGVIFSLAKD